MNTYLFLTFAAVIAAVAGDDPRNIQLLDLKPEEVQQLLAQQNTDLHFAPKINTIDVARTSPEDPDQIEDVYEASQFHGQDGLGRYLYGYAVPDHAKVEGRNGAGDVRGAYNWIGPRGNVIKVHYWDDGNGFHHEDNIPKVELHPAQETPALRAARLAHEAAWKAAAEANKVSPSQYRLVYNNNLPANLPSQQNYGQASEQKYNAYNPPQQQNAVSSTFRPPQSNYPTPQSFQQAPNYGIRQPPQFQQSYNAYAPQETRDSSVSVRRPESQEDRDDDESGDEEGQWRPDARDNDGDDGQWVPGPEDVTSEPRGFFYSFVYPAGIRYNKSEYDAKKLAPHDDITSLDGSLE